MLTRSKVKQSNICETPKKSAWYTEKDTMPDNPPNNNSNLELPNQSTLMEERLRVEREREIIETALRVGSIASPNE